MGPFPPVPAREFVPGLRKTCRTSGSGPTPVGSAGFAVGLAYLNEAKGSSSPTAKTWKPKELLDFFRTGYPAPGTNARRGSLTIAAARSRRRCLPQARGGLAVASQRGQYSRLASRRDAAEVESIQRHGERSLCGLLDTGIAYRILCAQYN